MHPFFRLLLVALAVLLAHSAINVAYNLAFIPVPGREPWMVVGRVAASFFLPGTIMAAWQVGEFAAAAASLTILTGIVGGAARWRGTGWLVPLAVGAFATTFVALWLRGVAGFSAASAGYVLQRLSLPWLLLGVGFAVRALADRGRPEVRTPVAG